MAPAPGAAPAPTPSANSILLRVSSLLIKVLLLLSLSVASAPTPASHLLALYPNETYKTARVPLVHVRHEGLKCCTDGRIGSPRVNDCVHSPYEGRLKRPVGFARPANPRMAYDCTISHKHKFIFPHIYKSGGSNLKNWFISVLCDGVAKKRGDNHPTANQACPGNVLKHVSCTELGAHPDYFAFVFVRHPVNRTISQYGMMTHRNFWTGGERPSLEEFVRSPLSASHGSRLARAHFHNQYDFVFNHQGCPVVDFVGHLETYFRDFYYVLRKIDSPELWEGFERYSFYGHRGNDPNVFGTNLRRELKDALVFTPEMEEIIYNRHPKDYTHLGYQRIFSVKR